MQPAATPLTKEIVNSVVGYPDNRFKGINKNGVKPPMSKPFTAFVLISSEPTMRLNRLFTTNPVTTPPAPANPNAPAACTAFPAAPSATPNAATPNAAADAAPSATLTAATAVAPATPTAAADVAPAINDAADISSTTGPPTINTADPPAINPAAPAINPVTAAKAPSTKHGFRF